MGADDAAVFITRHLTQLLGSVLGQLAKNEEVGEQLALANGIVAYLQDKSDVLAAGSHLAPEGQVLRAVLLRRQLPLAAQHDLGKHLNGVVRALQFSQSDLFSWGNLELLLEAELKKEIATADRIDFIVSFVKWSGLRLLLPSLQAFAERGKPFRLLMTTCHGRHRPEGGGCAGRAGRRVVVHQLQYGARATAHQGVPIQPQLGF